MPLTPIEAAANCLCCPCPCGEIDGFEVNIQYDCGVDFLGDPCDCCFTCLDGSQSVVCCENLAGTYTTVTGQECVHNLGPSNFPLSIRGTNGQQVVIPPGQFFCHPPNPNVTGAEGNRCLSTVYIVHQLTNIGASQNDPCIPPGNGGGHPFFMFLHIVPECVGNSCDGFFTRLRFLPQDLQLKDNNQPPLNYTFPDSCIPRDTTFGPWEFTTFGNSPLANICGCGDSCFTMSITTL